ncbi:hypothetical protein SLS54_007562 [Diplodia seriata]
MRFDVPLLATGLALTSTASAASCYSAGGCGTCASNDEVWQAREQLCGGDRWKSSTSFNWGWAVVNLSGRFSSQQACWDGFENIINQCYGKKNGGTYDWNYNGDSAHLDVNFCTCR